MFGLAGGDEEGAGALLTLAASGRDDPALFADVLALAPPLASPRRLSPHGFIVLLTCAGWAGAGGGSLYFLGHMKKDPPSHPNSRGGAAIVWVASWLTAHTREGGA